MNYKTIQPFGVLDGIRANQIRRDVHDMLTDGIQIILVDLNAVTFMNSSAIGALVATLKLVQGGGGQLYLCALNDQLKIIFEITKMDQIFNIYPDEKTFEAEMMASC